VTKRLRYPYHTAHRLHHLGNSCSSRENNGLSAPVPRSSRTRRSAQMSTMPLDLNRAQPPAQPRLVFTHVRGDKRPHTTGHGRNSKSALKERGHHQDCVPQSPNSWQTHTPFASNPTTSSGIRWCPGRPHRCQRSSSPTPPVPIPVFQRPQKHQRSGRGARPVDYPGSPTFSQLWALNTPPDAFLRPPPLLCIWSC